MPKTLEMFYLHLHSLSNMTSNFSHGVYLNILYKVPVKFLRQGAIQVIPTGPIPTVPSKALSVFNLFVNLFVKSKS